MNLRLIRPEDRRRSGGNGASPGSRAEWADTVPACFRSEAFAEDLVQDEPCGALLRRNRWPAVASVPRRAGGWVPLLGPGLAAALGLRSTAPD
jgi:hypothetical protein